MHPLFRTSLLHRIPLYSPSRNPPLSPRHPPLPSPPSLPPSALLSAVGLLREQVPSGGISRSEEPRGERERESSVIFGVMAGLEECEANLVVYLHPSKAKCANDAILSDLSSMLFTYNETFGGVVLAYDPNIRSNLAKILPGILPFFGVQLKAKLLLFNPKPDMVLEGEVVKLTPQSIHAVVLGFSSVVIADYDIRDEFKHKSKSGEEVYVSRTNRKHKIKVGTILRFSVKSFDEDILHISGSLLAHHTGCARWLDKNLDEWSRADSTATKRKIGDGKLANDGSMLDGETSLKNDEQIVKSKKRRTERT